MLYFHLKVYKIKYSFMGFIDFFQEIGFWNSKGTEMVTSPFEDFIEKFPIPLFITDPEGSVFSNNQTLTDLGIKFSHMNEIAEYLKKSEKDKLAKYINQFSHASQQSISLKSKNFQTVFQIKSVPYKKDPPSFLHVFQPIKKIHTLKNWYGAITDQFAVEMFEYGEDAVAVINHEGRLLAYNTNLTDYIGDSIQLNATFSSLLAPDSATEFEAVLNTIDETAPKDPLNLKFLGKDKVTLSSFLKPSKMGPILVHFLRTSDQEKIQLRLLQSQKLHAMGELAGGIAHDFNNLLTAMIGFCDLLLMRHSPGDQSFTDIMQIKQNANRAANLVRQLLAFSKQQTLQPRKIDVTDNIAELKLLLQRLIGTSIELNIIHGRDLGCVKVDQGQLEQVIINLVVNARDAMPSGGTIRIKTYTNEVTRPFKHSSGVIPKGSYVVIDVSDTGTGIAPENLPRIFDPFFSTKEVGTGTGLGLSTVYGIVSQMEGYIAVETEIGKGTTFRIYLPQYALEENERLAINTNEQQVKDLTGNSVILLVEDETAVRKFSARTLQEKGYEVIEAGNGREALEYLRSANAKGDAIDLIVTDVVMPEMDGPALVERAQKLLPDLKVIFMSGYAESTFRHRLSNDVDIHFLPKPFNLKDLAQKVKDITDGKSKKNVSEDKKKVITNYRSGT